MKKKLKNNLKRTKMKNLNHLHLPLQKQKEDHQERKNQKMMRITILQKQKPQKKMIMKKNLLILKMKRLEVNHQRKSPNQKRRSLKSPLILMQRNPLESRCTATTKQSLRQPNICKSKIDPTPYNTLLITLQVESKLKQRKLFKIFVIREFLYVKNMESKRFLFLTKHS